MKEQNTSASTSREYTKGGKGMKANVKEITELMKANDITLDDLQKELKKGKRGTKLSDKQKKDFIDRARKGTENSQELLDKFGISRTTARRYIFDNYTYTGIAEKVWDTFLENFDVHAEETTEMLDETVEEATDKTAEETADDTVDEAVDDSVENVSVNRPRFVIDHMIIKLITGRTLWNKLISKLETEHAEVYVHSKRKMEYISENHDSSYARIMAKSILEGKYSILSVLDTDCYLQDAAASIGATVITNSGAGVNFCKSSNIPYILLEDFVAEKTAPVCIEERVDPVNEEFVTKLTLPAKYNNNRRAIVEMPEIVKFAEQRYGEKGLKVTFSSEDGIERKTPTGKLRLFKDDRITIEGKTIKVILKVCSETEKDNCYEIYYLNDPSGAVAKTKFA